jgi:predicted metal-dependent HD superfamily phosphohydrolase
MVLGWEALLQPFHVNPRDAQTVFLELVAAYSRPDRFYHTLEHLQQVLETVERLRSRAIHFSAVQFAAWFHDVIYNPRAKDNELKSAEFAAIALTQLQIPPAEIARVQTLILSTQTHDATDIDAQILIDADLAIFGSSPSKYRAYARAIRQEYAWVSDRDYAVGRSQVLQGFLARSRIYSTVEMFLQLEGQARANLRSEILELGDLPGRG